MTPEQQFLLRLTCNAVWAAACFSLMVKMGWRAWIVTGLSLRRAADPAVLPGMMFAGLFFWAMSRALGVWFDLRANASAIAPVFRENYTLPAVSCIGFAVSTVFVIYALTPVRTRPWPALATAMLIVSVGASQWFRWF